MSKITREKLDRAWNVLCNLKEQRGVNKKGGLEGYRLEVKNWIKKTNYSGSYERAEKAYEAIYRSEGLKEGYKEKKDGFQDYEEFLKYSGKYNLSYAKGGRCVELKRVLGKKPKELGKKKGSIIDGYSRESRNRFLKFLLSIDYEKMGAPLFVTATYPGEYLNDPRVWKRDLKTLVERLKRRFPNCIVIWRLEPQKRGAPHFAMFIWGCEEFETREGKKLFSKMWYEIVGSKDERHLRAGTNIQQETDIKKRIFYMAKYITKKEKGGEKQEFDYPVGRYWGVYNKEGLSINIEQIEIDKEIFYRTKRIIRKMLKSKMAKDKHREAVKNKHNGIWASMPAKEVLKMLNYVVKAIEDEENETDEKFNRKMVDKRNKRAYERLGCEL